MIVCFGQHLDGLDPAVPKSAVGTVRLGPLGLLAALETDLGLPPMLEHAAAELARYRSCVATADDFARFYHASFAIDPISVAKTLSEWRATWYEHGWDGRFRDAPPRLADMAAIEGIAEHGPLPCLGQRLRAIEAALKGRKTQIERLILLDDIDDWTLAWQRVIKAIGYEVDAAVTLRPAAPPDTDLGRLQAALLEDEQAAGDGRNHDAPPAAKQETLRGDGTFVVVQSTSRDISAQAVAECLRGIDPDSAVVVAPQHGVMLDNALERGGLPRAGFRHRSRLRPTPQVLKLALALLWEPLDPHLLLQFLLHPVGPLPRDIRSTLADAVSQSPGIGGEAWQAAIEKALAKRTERDAAREASAAASDDDGDGAEHANAAGPALDATDGTADADAPAQAASRDTADTAALAPAASGNEEHDAARFAKDRAEDREAIRYWLESERFAASSGAPVQVIAERAGRCANWLARQAATKEGEAGAAATRALSQCRAFIASLEPLGQSARIAKLELERLLLEAATLESGTTNFAGAGHVRAATHPGAVTERFQQVFWWNLAAERTELAWPWSRAELQALADAGVCLPDGPARLRNLMRGWLRPIVNCERRLVLVLHGEESGRHPLWQRIQHRFTGWAETALDAGLLDGADATIPNLDVPTLKLQPRPPQPPKRWWALPADITLPTRELESYTSLSKLYDFPHAWALRYLARLRPARAAEVPDRALLYGSLAHRTLERFFTENPNWARFTPAQTADWLAAALPPLIASEGAVLLAKGRGTDRLHFAATMERTLPRLLAHLRGAQVMQVETERQEAQACGEFTLQGSIDLLLRTDAGREIVMDAKWASERFRQREMEDNRHLQLAVYAWLRRAANGGGTWPYPAYYIITSGNVLAPDGDMFPNAVPQAPNAGERIEDLWQRMQATDAWRRGQLARGEIEVNVRGAEADARSEPPPDTLPRRNEPDPFEEFRWLVGQGRFQ